MALFQGLADTIKNTEKRTVAGPIAPKSKIPYVKTTPKSSSFGGLAKQIKEKEKPIAQVQAPSVLKKPVVAPGPRRVDPPKEIISAKDPNQKTTPIPLASVPSAKPEKKGLFDLAKRAVTSGASTVAKFGKFALDYVVDKPSRVLGPFSPIAQSLDPLTSKVVKTVNKPVIEAVDKGVEKVDKIAQEANVASPEWEKASLKEKLTKRLGETVYNMAPQIAGSLAPYFVSPALGFAVSAGSTAEDVKQKAIKEGVDEERATDLGLATGAAVALLDRIIPSKTLGPSKKEFLGKFVARLIKSGAGEAGMEMGQEAIQIAAEKTFREDLGWDEVVTREVMAGLGGILGGSGMQGVGSFISSVTTVPTANAKEQTGEVTPPVAPKPPIPPSVPTVQPPVTQEIAPQATQEAKVVQAEPKPVQEAEKPVQAVKEEPLIAEARKYKSADEFVKAKPNTVNVWIKSKFSKDGAFADVPVIRKEEGITLYQGGSKEGRQFWTSDKNYASQFGEVTEKTGDFYKIDNGNRVTNVYVEAPTKSQLTDIWNKAQQAETPLAETATVEAPTKQSKVGKSIEAKAIEKGLTESFQGTAEYTPITIKDQAERASELLTDIEKVKRIVRGEESLPQGLLGGSFIKAVEDYALANNDPQLALDLANSKITSDTSVHAQEMRTLAERNPDSAVAKIQELKKARKEKAKKSDPTPVFKEIIKKAKAKATKESWSDFISSIEC